MMLSVLWLPQLPHDLESPAKESLLLLHDVILESYPTFHHALQFIQKLPHHPFREWRIKRLDFCGRGLARSNVEAPFEHESQNATGRCDVIAFVKTFGQNLNASTTRSFDHTDIVVEPQRAPVIQLHE